MCSNSHTFAIVLKAEFISSSSENWHKKKLILGKGRVQKKNSEKGGGSAPDFPLRKKMA